MIPPNYTRKQENNGTLHGSIGAEGVWVLFSDTHRRNLGPPIRIDQITAFLSQVYECNFVLGWSIKDTYHPETLIKPYNFSAHKTVTAAYVLKYYVVTYPVP